MEFKASEIAMFLHGEIVGDENTVVNTVSKIEEGMPGALAFMANPKYENFLYTTEASIVLVNRDLVIRNKVKTTLIKVENAYDSFAKLLEMYVQATQSVKNGIEQPCFIDPTAVIGENVYIGAFSYIGKNAIIGDSSQINPQVYVGENVKIGNSCLIYAGVKIYSDCSIGNKCILHSGVVVGSDGFGFAPQEDGTYKKIPQIGNVILEDDVEIGANTTIDCGTMGSTIIRKGVKLDNLIQVAHNCEIGENTVIASQTGLAGSTKLGKNCRIGGQVGFAGHMIIGNNVQIGAQAGIAKSLKDNEIHQGTPSINQKDFLRASIVFKNLPKLREEIIKLQKDIKTLKQGN